MSPLCTYVLLCSRFSSTALHAVLCLLLLLIDPFVKGNNTEPLALFICFSIVPTVNAPVIALYTINNDYTPSLYCLDKGVSFFIKPIVPIHSVVTVVYIDLLLIMTNLNTARKIKDRSTSHLHRTTSHRRE